MIQSALNKCSMKTVEFIDLPIQSIEVQNLLDMSSEAIAKTWYSQDEIAAMINENSRACFRLQQSKHLCEDDNICYRGLEQIFLPDYRVRRQKVMFDVKDAVLKEQDRQLRANSFNEELIAATYRDAVLYSTRIARRRGIRDEERIQHTPKRKLSVNDGQPHKKTRRKTGLMVRFDDCSSSHPIAPLQDIADEEKSDCWFKGNEYSRIKEAAVVDVRRYLRGQVLDSDDFTVRGLEKYLPNLYMIRKRNRLHSVNAVFEEQELQELEGANCPIRIAEIYQSNSIHCLLIAQNEAQQDMVDASTYLARNQKTILNSRLRDSGDLLRD